MRNGASWAGKWAARQRRVVMLCRLAFVPLTLANCRTEEPPPLERTAFTTQALSATVVLKANRSGRYVVLQGDKLNWSTGTSEQSGAAQFLQEASGSGFFLKALSNGKYVKRDTADKLVASATTSSAATLLKTEACGSKTAIMADKNSDGVVNSSDSNRYVKANDDVEAKNSFCDGNSATSWEKWELIEISPPPTGCREELLPILSAAASSVENSTKTANKAIDGNMTTRWSSAFSDPQWLSIDLGTTHFISRVTLHWENAASAEYVIQVSNDGSAWSTVHTEEDGNGGNDDITGLTATARYVRVFSQSRTTSYGVSLWELKVYGDSQPACNGVCGDGILAHDEDCDDGNTLEGDGCSGSCYLVPEGCDDLSLTAAAAISSSNEGSHWIAAKAIDSDMSTRWSSAFSDPQWLIIDLGVSVYLSRVVLTWEVASSAHYDIEISDTGQSGSWTTLYSRTHATSGNRIDIAPRQEGRGRFIRIYSRARTTQYGNSLWEVAAYGDLDPQCDDRADGGVGTESAPLGSEEDGLLDFETEEERAERLADEEAAIEALPPESFPDPNYYSPEN